MDEDDGSRLSTTIGNTLIADIERRPQGIESWEEFQMEMLEPHSVEDEWRERLNEFTDWDAIAVEDIGVELAEAAADIWFGE